MTIRARITWMFVLVITAIVLLFSGLVYFFANQNVFSDFYQRLELRARVTARVALDEKVRNNEAFTELRKQYLVKMPEQQEYVVRLGSRGQLDSGYSPQLPASLVRKVAEGGQAFYREGNLLYSGILVIHGGRQYVVVVSGRNIYGVTFLNNLMWLLIISFLIKALIIGFVGFVFSRRILKPVSDFTRKAQDISAYNLHVRLEDDNKQDEMAVLARTFNHMLDRLETSFESQRNFVAHASHELRTPLTAIIGEAEWALLKDRDPDTYRKSLAGILQQAERLDAVTRSLLSLARTDHAAGEKEMQLCRIDEKLVNAKEMAEALYPASQIVLDLGAMPHQEEMLLVKGYSELLHTAFSNLLINACKYGHGKPVVVKWRHQHQQAIISIEDEGIGIPAKDLPHIFDPFFRASNTTDYRGYGLGLAFARNIIRLHGGDISISSKEHKGTCITISLPLTVQDATV